MSTRPEYEERHECPRCHRVQVVYVRGATVAHRCPAASLAARKVVTFAPTTRAGARAA